MLVFERRHFYLIAALITLFAWSPAAVSAQAPPKTIPEPQPTLSQVVEKLVQKNAGRAEACQSYRGKRIYVLDYQGFPKELHAEMVVEMIYTAPAHKEFKILSESGSKFIVKRVLKRLTDEETEAQGAATRLSVELNSRNYDFTSLEVQTGASGCSYVLASVQSAE